MSVSQVNAKTNIAISEAKKDDTIELPFDKAFANLSVLANLKIGNWIGADLKNKNIVIWNYVSTWFYNPDNNIIELVSNSVKSVLNALENDKLNKPKIICEHEKIAKGFQTAVITYKAYPDLSKKLGEIAALWLEKQPTAESVTIANKLLILRTLKSVPKGRIAGDSFEKNKLFNLQRIKNETAVVAEGNYPKDVFGKHDLSRQRSASAALFPKKLSGEIKVSRGESSVIDRTDFCAALMTRRTKILGCSDKSE